MSFANAETAETVPQFKKFVSEDELEEKRRIRQEEWEKVRTPDQPLEAPEEIEDNRCLFDKLEEQKLKKQEEYEEQWKLKNQVKGLETEEAEFLDYVSNKQIEIEQNREKENEEVLQDLRNAVVNQVVDKTKGEEKTSLPTTKQSANVAQPRKSQLSMLAGAIKRKSTDVTPEDSKKPRDSDSEARHEEIIDHTAPATGTIHTSGIPGHTALAVGVLPGMGSYSDSSDDSCSSSDSDDIDTAVFQRPCIAKCTTEGHAHHH